MLPPAMRAPWLHLCLLSALGALLFLPSFAAEELDDEEGRRAVPAREMIESGDWILPRVFGEPYLNKPPLFFWSVAAASSVTGGVNEAATRLPSVLATIATALALYLYGRRVWGARAGLAAGALFLVTFHVLFGKGAFGELEAMFAFTAFLASACLARGRGVWAGVFLGAALLTKGPPALVFVGATALALWRTRPRGEREGRALGIALPIGATLLGAWVVAVFLQTDVSSVLASWGSEVARTSSDPLGDYLDARLRFLVGVLAGFLPPLGILLLSLGSRPRRALSDDRELALCETTLGLGLLFFALYPGTAARYAYPLLPWAALAAGRLLAVWSEAPHGDRRLAGALRVVALVGLLVAGAAGWLGFAPIGDVEGLGSAGFALATVLLGVSAWLWRAAARGRDGTRLLWSAFAVLALVRGIFVFDVLPGEAGHRGRRVAAARLQELVPVGGTLHHAATVATNELFYVDRRVLAAGDPLELNPGSLLLIRPRHLERLRARGLAAAEVGRVDVYDEADGLVVVRIEQGIQP